MARSSGVVFAAELGVRDLRREPTALMCQVLAFSAVLAPLLVLYGLKFGIISTLTHDLLSDPRSLQINLVGDDVFDTAAIEALRRNPLVGFVSPHTRALAASVDVVKDRSRGPIVQASLLASRAEDPLLPGGVAPPTQNQAVVSAGLARALGTTSGEPVTVVLERQLDGNHERVFLTLTVTGLIDAALWDTRGALVHLDTMLAIERWRDGYAVPELSWTGRTGGPRPDRYPNLRLYAAGLDELRPLVDELRDQKLELRSRIGVVEGVLGLNRSLNGIFAIIASVAGVGYALAFGAMLWANIVRKGHEISLLRLQGMGRRAVVGFPIAQALVIAVLGIVIAVVVAQGTCAGIDQVFGEGLMVSGQACHLRPHHQALAAAVGLAVALLASLVAAVRVTRVDPAGGLHVL